MLENYKVASPEKTINNIRNILFDYEIFTIESWIRDEFLPKSVRIETIDLPIGTNGKGINEKYALASAYAEFMERIQNLILLDGQFSGIKKDIAIRHTDYIDFDYNKFKQENQDILKELIFFKDISEIDSIVTGFSNKLYSYPFLNIKTGKTEFLPKLFMRMSVGSNGMCAGNSPAEALIQGICEIFERYALKKIYKTSYVSLPSVPDSYLKRLTQWKYFKFFRSKGYEIYVKDCSFGGKIPVAGVLIKKGDKALFNLGSSPSFSIAIERCIDELMQGVFYGELDNRLQPITTLDQEMPNRTFSTKEKRIDFQYYTQLSCGQAIIPPSVFDNSEQFNPTYLFEATEVTSNKCLKSLIDIVIKLGFTPYIRDVSFLEFCAYHVYIPGMSEIMQLNCDRIKLFHYDIPKATEIFYNINSAGNEEINFLINIIKELNDNPIVQKENILKFIYNLNFKQEVSLSGIEPENLLPILFYKIKDYKAAYDTLEKYLKNKLGIDNYYNPPKYSENHFCLLKFFFYLKEGEQLNNAKKKVSAQYNESIVNEIFELLNKPNFLSEYLDIPNCGDCNNCKYKKVCCFENLATLKKQLKNKMEKYTFDQSHLKNIIK